MGFIDDTEPTESASIDPINFQQREDAYTIELQGAANYMGVNNTVGNKLWEAEKVNEPLQENIAPASS